MRLITASLLALIVGTSYASAASSSPNAPGQTYLSNNKAQGPGYPGGPGDYRGASGYAPGMQFPGGGQPPVVSGQPGASSYAPGHK